MLDRKIEVDYKIEESDSVKLSIELTKNGMRKGCLVINLYFIIMLAFGISMISIGMGPGKSSVILSFAYLVGFYIIVRILLWLLMVFSAKKAYRNNKLAQEEVHLIIDSETYHAKSKSNESTIEWNSFRKYKRVKSGHVLFYGVNQGVVIPSKFLSEEDNLMLYQFLKKVIHK